MTLRWGSIILMLFLSISVSHLTYCQVDESGDSPEKEYRYDSAYRHRSFLSPTVDLSPGLFMDVNAGVYGGYIISCCGFISPVISAGIAPFDSMLYIEVGTMQMFEEARKGYKFPANIGIRGDVLRTDLFKVGFGYQYQDIYYHSRDYDLPPFYSLHWFYTGLAYTPRNNSYALNVGPRVLDKKIIGAVFSLTASFPLSTYWSFLIDLNSYGSDLGGALLAGLRYHNRSVRVDIATVFGFVWLITVGIPFY